MCSSLSKDTILKKVKLLFRVSRPNALRLRWESGFESFDQILTQNDQNVATRSFLAARDPILGISLIQSNTTLQCIVMPSLLIFQRSHFNFFKDISIFNRYPRWKKTLIIMHNVGLLFLDQLYPIYMWEMSIFFERIVKTGEAQTTASIYHWVEV